MSFAIVATTLDDKAAAEAMAAQLVTQGLVACAQITPIQSLYVWQGALQKVYEYRLEMKIVASDYAVVEAAVRVTHPYKTPEIVCIPIVAGYGPYLDWVKAAAAKA